MTDNEIIKAMKWCLKNRIDSCDLCTVRKKGSCKDLMRFALNLINRLQKEIKYLKYVTKCQQSNYLPCNIGDTAYCVNGYGSKRYIEKFTVAEIRITKDGIWLTDTNGMEWLARVCHFNRDSAENHK